MAGNVWNCRIWKEMAGMAGIGMTGRKWLAMAGYGWKWLEMAEMADMAEMPRNG